MASLADYIESYLKLLLSSVPDDWVEIRRRDLAERFRCAPSQISYVLTTRFSIERGYVVESRRGGGGYIRIFRLGAAPEGDALEIVRETVGDAIDRKAADDLIARLAELGAISAQDAAFVRAAVLEGDGGRRPELEQIVRARVLKTILLFVLTQSTTE
ncbi:MAG TPA: CtsR family transcriptional regulator [Bacillota bacterium]|jgi:transcriptional regulator CtsR|nr:CtsR family transcriptional regulator [Bacillota bacterium]